MGLCTQLLEIISFPSYRPCSRLYFKRSVVWWKSICLILCDFLKIHKENLYFDDIHCFILVSCLQNFNYFLISLPTIISEKNEGYMKGCFVRSIKVVVSDMFRSAIFFPWMPLPAPFGVWMFNVWVTYGRKIFLKWAKLFLEKTFFFRVGLVTGAQMLYHK